jgi:hypothetical protein
MITQEKLQGRNFSYAYMIVYNNSNAEFEE